MAVRNHLLKEGTLIVMIVFHYISVITAVLVIFQNHYVTLNSQHKDPPEKVMISMAVSAFVVPKASLLHSHGSES
jgi:hypothetical protein